MHNSIVSALRLWIDELHLSANQHLPNLPFPADTVLPFLQVVMQEPLPAVVVNFSNRNLNRWHQ
jgi:hypothetical protein